MREGAIVKAAPAVAAGLMVVAASGAARAAYMDLCCDSVAHPDGACVASESACPSAAAGFALGLHNLSLAEAVQTYHWPDACLTDPTQCPSVAPGFVGSQFPPGVDGYTFMTTEPPWWGLCFLAPDPNDPTHMLPAAPVACMTTTVLAGVGAESAIWQFPHGDWDAVMRCYGPQVDVGPPDGLTCALPAALGDHTLILQPDGSCCSPPIALDNSRATPSGWTFDVRQEIPGVLAPWQSGVAACATPACGQPPANPGFVALATDSSSQQQKVPESDTSGCSIAREARDWPALAAVAFLLALPLRRRARGSAAGHRRSAGSSG
jgi:hypothetical protein